MKMRMLFLAMIPCLMMIGCGVEDSEPTDNEGLRGGPVEPCNPDDCVPLSPQIENDCPPGTELVSGAECIDAEGECVWDFWEACVPSDPPQPIAPPPPSEGPPRGVKHG